MRRVGGWFFQTPGEAGGELAAAEVELAEALEVVLEVVVDTRPATLGEDRDVAGDRRLETDQPEVAEGGAVRRQPRREDRISRSVEVDEVTPFLETPDVGAAAAAHVRLDRGPPGEQVEDDPDGGRTDAEVRVVPDPVVEVVLEAAIGVGRAPLIVGAREDQAHPVVERQQVVEAHVGALEVADVGVGEVAPDPPPVVGVPVGPERPDAQAELAVAVLGVAPVVALGESGHGQDEQPGQGDHHACPSGNHRFLLWGKAPHALLRSNRDARAAAAGQRSSSSESYGEQGEDVTSRADLRRGGLPHA